MQKTARWQCMWRNGWRADVQNDSSPLQNILPAGFFKKRKCIWRRLSRWRRWSTLYVQIIDDDADTLLLLVSTFVDLLW